jgi:hypothetical protein
LLKFTDAGHIAPSDGRIVEARLIITPEGHGDTAVLQEADESLVARGRRPAATVGLSVGEDVDGHRVLCVQFLHGRYPRAIDQRLPVAATNEQAKDDAR